MKRRRRPQTASLQERRDKSGKLISYSIRVHRGRGADGRQLKPWTATFDGSPTWSEKTARKKAEAFAATFEKQCREGLTSDGRKKFAEYCDYVLALKEQRGAKHSTVVRYRELTERIYPAIGHIKLNELRADHLNSLYTELSKPGSAKSRSWAHSKTDLAAVLKERGISRAKLAEVTGLPLNKVYAAVRGERVNAEAAEAVCKALNLKLSEAFLVMRDNKALSAKTVLEHRRLISTVLEQALKEGLVAVNVASRATLPKVERKEANYFQPEQIAAIREALEHEPLKWKALVHMLLITDAPMHPDSVTDYLKKLSRRYGLPHLNPHAFRHTMASMLYYNGVDSVSISKRLGHAQVSTPQKKNPKLKPSVSGFNLEKEEQGSVRMTSFSAVGIKRRRSKADFESTPN